MSVTEARPPLAPAPPDKGIGPRRWTREEYYRAAELGLFRPQERLELLDGEIIAKVSPQKGLHANTVANAAQLLGEVFGPGHHVRSQLPLPLGGRSELEPDVLVVAGGPFDHPTTHPQRTDVQLIVEVSDTTLRYDRGRKRAAYARAGILEYWILNLPDRQLEVYRDPSGSRYRSVTVYWEQDVVTPLAVPAITIRVADLLPPAA